MSPFDEDESGPEKLEEQGEFTEAPDGWVDLISRQRRATRVDGGRIIDARARLVRDFCCWCPPSKADGGLCAVGKRRVCADHAVICSICGRPSCHRHRSIVNDVPVCHECLRQERHPDWVLFVAIGLFGLVYFLYLHFTR